MPMKYRTQSCQRPCSSSRVDFSRKNTKASPWPGISTCKRPRRLTNSTKTGSMSCLRRAVVIAACSWGRKRIAVHVSDTKDPQRENIDPASISTSWYISLPYGPTFTPRPVPLPDFRRPVGGLPLKARSLRRSSTIDRSPSAKRQAPGCDPPLSPAIPVVHVPDPRIPFPVAQRSHA